MILVKYKAVSPEENLALEELLLEASEKGELDSNMRFWETSTYSVIVGRAGKISEECREERCANDGIKILRRISGGGSVLQGPGCLNYSLVLRYADDLSFGKINDSYRYMLRRISEALCREGFHTEFFPVSDIAYNGKKISGNSQARKKNAFLHHGTILYKFDIKKTALYLKHPPREPAYRVSRKHEDFITNIPMERRELERAISACFSDGNCRMWSPGPELLARLDTLVKNKYLKDNWNYSF